MLSNWSCIQWKWIGGHITNTLSQVWPTIPMVWQEPVYRQVEMNFFCYVHKKILFVYGSNAQKYYPPRTLLAWTYLESKNLNVASAFCSLSTLNKSFQLSNLFVLSFFCFLNASQFMDWSTSTSNLFSWFSTKFNSLVCA